MKHIVIASMRKNAGKTSLIVGLAGNTDLKLGYLKPFGDRLLYRKKRLWDFDAAAACQAMGVSETPESMSIGFDHSKLRYMYDKSTMADKVKEISELNAVDKDVMLVEGSSDWDRGISVHLDAISLVRTLDAELVVVLSGSHDEICDDAHLLHQTLGALGVRCKGIVANRVKDVEDFKSTHLEELQKVGLPILGIIPDEDKLTHPSMKFISDLLFAKLLAGADGLSNTIRDIFVGAMSADAVLRVQKFNRPKKLVITSGDRSDMILAALDTKAAGVVLTNNILPPANIIAKADSAGIPLLLVAQDTFHTAKKLDNLVSLTSSEDEERISLLGRLVAEHVNLEEIF